MKLTLQVDIKNVRKAFALINEDIPSDETIKEKMDEAEINLKGMGEDGDKVEMMLILSVIGEKFS